MADEINCLRCNAGYDVLTALRASTVSWPSHNWIYFVCPACGLGTHLEVLDGQISIIAIVGAPGPDYERIRSVPVPGLIVGVVPTAINCWLEDEEFSFPKCDW